MPKYANLSNGVAPIWIETGDGNYTPPGTCIGFYVEVGGAVSFVSNGNTITKTFASNQVLPVQVDSFLASGTTASGICAMVI
jgi:hypothetical protein